MSVGSSFERMLPCDTVASNYSECESESSVLYEPVGLDLIRQPTHLLVIYCIAYGVVFVVGLVGNVFVVVAVARGINMHTVTNYFITSLAVADLLIIVFCLPATLMNNVLTEWLLGNFLCKISVWVNGTTVCASVYTLVAVSADRYFALCHTMRYGMFEKRKTFFIIFPVWILSCILFSPWLFFFQEIHYPISEDANASFARVCIPAFPDEHSESLFFLVVNFIVAFLVPLIAIILCYSYIFSMVLNRKSIAVDRKASEREHRMRLKVTNMMITVVVLFAASWLPLYLLFTYIYFGSPDLDGYEGFILMNVLKPIFQWLSLANSCINPILYAYFSLTFRREFMRIIVAPCRKNVDLFRKVTRDTIRRYNFSASSGSESGNRKQSGNRLETEAMVPGSGTSNDSNCATPIIAQMRWSPKRSLQRLLSRNNTRQQTRDTEEDNLELVRKTSSTLSTGSQEMRCTKPRLHPSLKSSLVTSPNAVMTSSPVSANQKRRSLGVITNPFRTTPQRKCIRTPTKYTPRKISNAACCDGNGNSVATAGMNNCSNNRNNETWIQHKKVTFNKSMDKFSIDNGDENDLNDNEAGTLLVETRNGTVVIITDFQKISSV